MIGQAIRGHRVTGGFTVVVSVVATETSIAPAGARNWDECAGAECRSDPCRWGPASAGGRRRDWRGSALAIAIRSKVASEVDRYCSWPGQACGYKVGHSDINPQREKATTGLGAKFELKAFNDTVVRGGNVPVDVLAKNVDEYVRTTSR